MYNKPRRESSFDKFKGQGKFGGGRQRRDGDRDRAFSGGGRDRFDRDERESHDAVCAECGEPCTVPFKPNGRRPVLCRSCFKKGDDRSVPRRYGSMTDDRPPRRREEHSGPAANPAFDRLVEQLVMINGKLDRIIDALGAKAPVEKKKKAVVKKVKKSAPKAAPTEEAAADEEPSD